MAVHQREISSKRSSGLIHIFRKETGEDRPINPFPEFLEEEVYLQIMGDPNYWISAELEERLITHISQYVDVAGSFFHLGTETLITNVYDLLPMSNARLDLKEILLRLPILLNRLTRIVYMDVDEIGPNKFQLLIHYFPRFSERWYDVIFFKGMLKGLAVLFELQNYSIELTRTKLLGLHTLHKEIGIDIQFGSDTNEFQFSWSSNSIELSRSELNPEEFSNRHKVLVVSKNNEASQTNEDYSVIDISDVVDKSRQLAIENRDLEAAVQVLKSFKSELEKKQKSIAKDLRLAKNIQQGLIPTVIPDWKGIQFWCYYRPMQEVSGDYYDYFPFNTEKLGVVLCDVSGHGVPAAFITALSKMLFSSFKKNKPSEIFKIVNRELLDLVKQQGYSTCLYAIIQEDYRVVYCIAGHPRPIHYSARTGQAKVLEGEGTFLGMFPDAADTFVDQSIQLEPGDKIFLYTDGIVEAENDQGEAFGEDRLLETINSCAGNSIQSSVERIMQVHREFTVGTDPMDDITLLGWELSSALPKFNELRKAGENSYNMKNYKEAVQSYRLAHELLPRELGTQLSFGRALAMAGDYETAIEMLESYNSYKTNNFLSHSVLGYCYYKLNQIDKAESEWKRAHHLNDENISILYNLGIIYQRQSQKSKLLGILEKIKRIHSSHESIMEMEKRLESMPDENQS